MATGWKMGGVAEETQEAGGVCLGSPGGSVVVDQGCVQTYFLIYSQPPTGISVSFTLQDAARHDFVELCGMLYVPPWLTWAFHLHGRVLISCLNTMLGPSLSSGPGPGAPVLRAGSQCH